MSRTVALNALFLLAGYASSTVDTILYRLALIAIVLLLHTLWIRAKVKRQILTNLAGALGLPPVHQDTIQYAQSASDHQKARRSA